MMEYREILYSAFGNFAKAIDLWLERTQPRTSQGRVRRFDLYDGVVFWPYIDEFQHYYYYSVSIQGHSCDLHYDRELIIKTIIDLTGGQPRKLFRILRRVQAATAWCLARAEGRKRAAARKMEQNTLMKQKE